LPRELNIQSVRDRMPARYRVNPYLRWISVIAQLVVTVLCLYVLFYKLTAVSSWLIRILPLVVLFVSLDSLFRHLTSLNEVLFTPECLWFRYILRPSVPIEYDRITSLELRKVLTYYVFLGFTDRSGKARVLKTQASFPRMLEIMFNIADLAPHVVMNQELDKMVHVIRDLKAKSDQPADEN